ncbi:GDP-L-fucose synthase [Candidatus Methylopumilus planktonicus]|uniref:GDP-L-fucose synthase n=1 Tax=Candidatus Methylopumilus planktonicus TaxID=1581557 RepID=UPI0011213584|nr:GDP-L-fucose synthase [Candidatus Methylopumilus planktonicus]QDD01806.1 GDP-L-fucose synthase [Candidatus Methylopumilus planktonicus]
MIDFTSKIYVAGHQGMVGSAIVRELRRQGYQNIITRTRRELDLTNQVEVKKFFELEKPSQVYLAAAKVGGIHANNTYPAEFIYQNLMIQSHLIHEAFRINVNKLLFLGSSCIYPKVTSYPMKEETLLTGILEPTNEPYAIAKIAGIKMCESYNRQYGVDYRSVMPTNLYGIGDNYHLENSHVIPALIRRFHEAKENKFSQVIIWGSGNSMREFLNVDDMASASVHVMNLNKNTHNQNTYPMQSHINVGSGSDVTIKHLAEIIASTVGYIGEIIFDHTKPDGTKRKLMDSSLLNSLGWQPKVNLIEGLRTTYQDFLKNIETIRK